ncbi:MAG: hypothetical protein H7842_03325 [Gammaproteobacteria bacterium SHHR-1]|uniref:hypothetical protein n=1 Tax=Magnetovirga frankeli TaxID=947516 RepID=UPI0012930260|nr:hypothetical protein D5125_09965 [gamma proteobacterium SS-5]
MNLAKEDIDYIKHHIGEWLAEASLGKPPVVYEIELRERMVRVEEELKHQRELMKQGFDAMDRRFEAMDKRFEMVEKRFEDLNKRFDRFMIWSLSLTLSVGGMVIAALKLWP